MKRFVVTLASLCAALILSVALAAGVAKACTASLQGTSCLSCEYASLSCSLSGSDTNYCYYNCSCRGSARACDQIADQIGLEAY